MLVWGSGHKTIERDVVDNFVCRSCHRADRLSVVVDYDYSHIYWLFRFARNRKTSLVCKNCSETYDADKEKETELFSKLGGNPIPVLDRFTGAALLLLVATGVAASYLSQVNRDSSGAIVSAGAVGVLDIRVGDCFDDRDTSSEAGEAEITSVRGVPCSAPHDNEVFAVFDLDLESLPEDGSLPDIAFDECLQRFESFVGRDYWSSSLDILPMYPTPRSWNEARDREVICAVYDVELRKLQGSMEGTGI